MFESGAKPGNPSARKITVANNYTPKKRELQENLRGGTFVSLGGRRSQYAKQITNGH
jgi:hypothetical protein